MYNIVRNAMTKCLLCDISLDSSPKETTSPAVATQERLFQYNLHDAECVARRGPDTV